MAAYNVVRFRVMPGSEQQFIEAHERLVEPGFEGFLGGSLVRTGDRTFCMIGEWRDFQSIVDARPLMIGFLDSVRHMLEDLGGGLGVTDPASGEVAVRLRPRKAAKKARPAAKRGGAKRAGGKRSAGKRAAGKRRR
jgi:quinol monooxygenase YgiN